MADQMNRNQQQGSNFNKGGDTGNNKTMPGQQDRNNSGGKGAGLGSQQQQRNQKGSDSGGMKQNTKQNVDE